MDIHISSVFSKSEYDQRDWIKYRNSRQDVYKLLAELKWGVEDGLIPLYGLAMSLENFSTELIYKHMQIEKDIRLFFTTKGLQNLPPNEIVKITQMFFKPVKYLHSFDLVHRDIAPKNYFLVKIDGKYRILLGDFEITAFEGAPNNDFNGHSVGSLGYAPLEQCVPGPVTKLMDIYALGISLVEVLSEKSFALDMGMTGQWGYLHNAIDTISQKFNPSIAKVLTKATQKNSKDRYQTIEEFEEELIQAILS